MKIPNGSEVLIRLTRNPDPFLRIGSGASTGHPLGRLFAEGDKSRAQRFKITSSDAGIPVGDPLKSGEAVFLQSNDHNFLALDINHTTIYVEEGPPNVTFRLYVVDDETTDLEDGGYVNIRSTGKDWWWFPGTADWIHAGDINDRARFVIYTA